MRYASSAIIQCGENEPPGGYTVLECDYPKSQSPASALSGWAKPWMHSAPGRSLRKKEVFRYIIPPLKPAGTHIFNHR